MRRWAMMGASFALAAQVTVAVAGEPLPREKAESAPWYSRVLGGEKKAEADKTFGNTSARPPVLIAPLEPAVLADALKAEQEAWERRLEVCHKLRVLAAAANDESLERQAGDLEKQATTLYHHRAARLGVKAPLRGTPEPVTRSLTSATTPTHIAPAPTGARTFKVVNP